MARKGAKRRKANEIKKQEKEMQGQVKSKKKTGKHVLDKLEFTSGANEKMYNHLASEFLVSHLPKIMDIVPKEVREERGDDSKTPGKLFDENIKSIQTKNTYVKRIKTFIKWHVIEKKIYGLGDITEESTREFFQLIADNVGTSSDKYSTKTYDAYVDGVYKYFSAVTTPPKEGKTKLEGREFGGVVESSTGLRTKQFRDDLRKMAPNYSSADYKRGKKDGYSVRDSKIIMKQAEKLYDIEKKLLVATLVYTGARNEELRNTTLDCYDTEKQNFNMLNQGMNKQNRPRVVTEVNEELFDLVEQYKELTGAAPDNKIFAKYSEEDVREIVKECCTAGKIGYSGVHDIRKPFIESEQKRLVSGIRKGEISKEDVVDKIIEQVSVDERLNPMVPKTKSVPRYYKGKKKGYRQVPVNPPEMVRKFDKEALMKRNIENLVDLYLAEQLGHNKVETNLEYLGKTAREFRDKFRKEMAANRKSGVKGL